MPRRTDLKSILIIGAGPIVIGQACEFDYSGAQACKALREEGYRVILVNSNPATIMTDPEMADATYIEPITWQMVERIIEKERPDALLPTMGGQTALNCALDLAKHGVLEKYGVEMIGASREAIDKAEDREKFKQAMTRIGLASARSSLAHSMEEALQVQAGLGYPVVIRPSFTLGGTGGGIAYNREEFVAICERGLEASPTHELLIEESLIGWKEFEMEVVRDHADNCIIVCSIENLDPMGVHTGDSITVAPAQTLTDKEYQIMRDASIAVLREIGVDTGGSNVQFAINPQDGRMVVIEMNPRVSRSSALASKATGFPIAKVAAKLAVGYTLDELRNDITGGATPASFEPTIDYVVTKVPRFAFEKFPQANDRLTTQMKSVGEVMAIGRTFQESFQKALRGLEVGVDGLNQKTTDRETIEKELGEPGPERIWYVGDAFENGFTLDEVHQLTHIDPWFLDQIKQIVDLEMDLDDTALASIDAEKMRMLKRKGFSDRRLAYLFNSSEAKCAPPPRARRAPGLQARRHLRGRVRHQHRLHVFDLRGRVRGRSRPTRKKIMVLGGGPNRIGQGIEFDYCCVHAALALREDGYETIMVNCNPETVSTDYDTSDRLYFEPLTLEDVLEIVDGGKAGRRDRAVRRPDAAQARAGPREERRAHHRHLARLDRHRGRPRALPEAAAEAEAPAAAQPHRAQRRRGAIKHAEAIGYPVVVRPELRAGRPRDGNRAPAGRPRALHARGGQGIERLAGAARPLPVGRDRGRRGLHLRRQGHLHRRHHGAHRAGRACTRATRPAACRRIRSPSHLERELRRQTVLMAKALNVVGLMNVQFAIQRDTVYVLEVNPRASRTVPFVSKATGLPLAKIAARCMAGKSLAAQQIGPEVIPPYFSVKEAVFPFAKFPGVDTILGPEMKSTGEVMGVGETFGEAFVKSQLAAGVQLPKGGRAFISVRDGDKLAAVGIARDLVDLGFTLLATRGTAAVLAAHGLAVTAVNKVAEGRPHIVDMIKNGEVSFIVNTVEDKRTAIRDSRSIRISALAQRVTYYTNLSAAAGAVGARPPPRGSRALPRGGF